MRNFLLILILFLIHQTGFGQNIEAPIQAQFGPGGSDYVHDSLRTFDFAENAGGYWLYEPSSPKPEKANVVVLIHGYGAYNPMVYGAWIKHLVLKGNIVIFPRYQKNLFSPSTDQFVGNTVKGIQDALKELQSGDYVVPNLDQISLIGHSYGGVISANLGINYKTLGIPYPHAVMLCSPGSGPFKGALLKNYSAMPPKTKLLILVSEDDHTVGDKVGILIYETAINVKNRNLLRQYPDNYGQRKITASHTEACAYDENFDSGPRNFSISRAERRARVDAMDYYGYWKLFDALLDCARSNENCNIAFGGTPEQVFLGQWSDGTPIKGLDVRVPDSKTKTENRKQPESTQ